MVTGLFDRKTKPKFSLKDFIMSENVFIISIAIAAITGIGAIGHDSYVQTKAIEKNIENAIVKGIDPLAVRCAYVRRDDTICIVYAANSPTTPTGGSKK